MRRGRSRGGEVRRFGQTRGWLWAEEDQRARWGRNTIYGFSDAAGRGPMLITDFDDVRGRDECQATHGDSGGEFSLGREKIGDWPGFSSGLIRFMTPTRPVGMVRSFWHRSSTEQVFMSVGTIAPVRAGPW